MLPDLSTGKCRARRAFVTPSPIWWARTRCRSVGRARSLGQHRSSQQYVPLPDDFESLLVKELIRLALAHPRWGYRQVHGLLVDSGWSVNRKRVERLWRLEGCGVPPVQGEEVGQNRWWRG
jgi:hypothetical protein